MEVDAGKEGKHEIGNRRSTSSARKIPRIRGPRTVMVVREKRYPCPGSRRSLFGKSIQVNTVINNRHPDGNGRSVDKILVADEVKDGGYEFGS